MKTLKKSHNFVFVVIKKFNQIFSKSFCHILLNLIILENIFLLYFTINQLVFIWSFISLTNIYYIIFVVVSMIKKKPVAVDDTKKNKVG